MEYLADTLGIEAVEVVDADGSSVVVAPSGDEDTDHAAARQINYDILKRGTEALDLSMKIARESENPRAIEVMSGLMKNLSDISKNLVVLNKDKSEAKSARLGKNAISQTPSIGTQNIVFTGSSAELNKFIKGE